MALFDRFKGYDDFGKEVPKLPIWPTITTVAEVLSEEVTEAAAITRFDLAADEQAEFAQVKTKVDADIAALESALTASGVDAAAATTISRAVVRNSVTQVLMRAELQYCTRAEFNASLGISG